jgi:hypothetical protein
MANENANPAACDSTIKSYVIHRHGPADTLVSQGEPRYGCRSKRSKQNSRHRVSTRNFYTCMQQCRKAGPFRESYARSDAVHLWIHQGCVSIPALPCTKPQLYDSDGCIKRFASGANAMRSPKLLTSATLSLLLPETPHKHRTHSASSQMSIRCLLMHWMPTRFVCGVGFFALKVFPASSRLFEFSIFEFPLSLANL